MRSLILSVCVLLTLSACKDENAAQKAEVIRPVRAMTVGVTQSYNIRKFPGRAEASDAVTLAFEVPGKLEEIPVNVGEKVTKGEVLASLDSRDFQNALDLAKAELKRAQSQYERMTKAITDHAVSKQDLTNAEAAYNSAKATVRIKEKALEDTKLLAPYDSIVTAKYVKSYENIQAKQPVVRLVDPTRIKMVGDVPEDIIPYVREGMKILVEFDTFPGVIIEAHIYEVAAESSQVTRTYPVTLIMNQPDDITILPGMAGKAWRAPEETPSNLAQNLQGFEVPVSAILSTVDGNSYVWVIDPQTNSVSKTLVTTGALSKNGVLIQGLKGGEIIATAGVHYLQDGQTVKIMKEAYAQ